MLSINVSSSSIRIALPINRLSWIQFTWVGGLILLCYWPVLRGLAKQCSFENDTAWGFFALPVSALILWRRREEIRAMVPRPNWWGLGVVVLGAALLLLAALAAEIFTARVALVITLIGAVWFLGGTGIVRMMAFPLFLLFFIIPLPTIVQNQITLPLARVVNWLSATVLSAVDIPVLDLDSQLVLSSGELTPAHSGAGMGWLPALVLLSLVYGHFLEKRAWVRASLLLVSLPVLILARGICIITIGILAQREALEAVSLPRIATSGIGLTIAMALLFAFHRLLMTNASRRARRDVVSARASNASLNGAR